MRLDSRNEKTKFCGGGGERSEKDQIIDFAVGDDKNLSAERQTSESSSLVRHATASKRFAYLIDLRRALRQQQRDEHLQRPVELRIESETGERGENWVVECKLDANHRIMLTIGPWEAATMPS
jgi:hypothetical protein